ncbi:MAG: radical SAM protein [Clostridia bacterium]|nr:radical SAM protein [Clostridia bacterium]
MISEYLNCSLCPRNCKIDRTKSIGYCGESDKLRISRAALHMWEEPCISGKDCSGAIFFEGCNLKCVFCQNYNIANNKCGDIISSERLVEIFYELKDQGANNINLVTGTHFTPTIAECIRKAKSEGFDLPFVWNSSSYEKQETIKMLDGLIDIFLPDYKYYDLDIAKKYSNAEDYQKIATRAIDTMLEIVGKPQFFNNDIKKKGVIIRHLVLPGRSSESIKIIKDIYNRYGNDVFVSIMNQYTPMPNIAYHELARRTTTYEYEKVVKAAVEIGITQGFTQDRETQSDSFIPEFDLTGVHKNNH